MIYLDISVSLRPPPISELRAAVGPDVTIVCDASHGLGLVMGGVFGMPLREGADILSANTHKSLPGPHRAIVAFADAKRGAQISAKIKGSFVSSTHTASLLALCVTLVEFQHYGDAYARQIVLNANTLGASLRDAGREVRSLSHDTYTLNHQLHCYVDLDRHEVIRRFNKNGVHVSVSGALGNRLFLRLGLQEVTMRGMRKDDMILLARLVAGTLDGEHLRTESRRIATAWGGPAYGR